MHNKFKLLGASILFAAMVPAEAINVASNVALSGPSNASGSSQHSVRRPPLKDVTNPMHLLALTVGVGGLAFGAVKAIDYSLLDDEQKDDIKNNIKKKLKFG